MQSIAGPVRAGNDQHQHGDNPGGLCFLAPWLGIWIRSVQDDPGTLPVHDGRGLVSYLLFIALWKRTQSD